MAIIEAKVVGLEPLLAKFEGLKQSITNKHTRRAVTKGTRVVAKVAKARAPIRQDLRGTEGYSGRQLKKSMGSKTKTYRGTIVVGIVGPRTGFKIQIGVRKRGKKVGQPIWYDPAKIAHIVERRQAFMRPAWDASKGEALQTIAEDLEAGIAKEMTK